MKKTLRFNPGDNVAIAIEDIAAGEPFVINGEESGFVAAEAVPTGHKIALRDFADGDAVEKYGHAIGAAIGAVKKGAWMSEHNIKDPTSNWKEVGRNVKFDPTVPAAELPDTYKLAELPKLTGYRRSNGRVGFRNHLLVVSTVVCANQIVDDLGAKYRDIICVPNPSGCVIVPHEIERVTNILLGLARNPNVGGVIFVGLGCENMNDVEWFYDQTKAEKPTNFIRVHSEGSTTKAFGKLEKMALEMKAALDKEPRTEASVADIIVGTKCGGSDWTSAIISNPSIGYACDIINKNGGTAILGETYGWFGGHTNLVKQCRTKEAADKIIALLDDIFDRSVAVGNNIEDGNPAPGNKKGGITTLLEKSLGNVKKGGTAPIEGVLDCAESPAGKGLYLLDNGSLDTISTFGLTLSSCNVILFTTGRGTPTGTPVAPVIKVSGSPYANGIFGEHVDCDLRPVVYGDMSIADAGHFLFERLIATLNGDLTASERFKCREFSFPLSMIPL